MKRVLMCAGTALVAMWPSVACGEWVDNGVAICIEREYENALAITSDGSGGAIIAWSDCCNGTNQWDLYAQRIDARGVLLWPAAGAPVSTAIWAQVLPQIISDGSGGAIVLWEDWRGGRGNLYAQRLDASGSALWALNGVTIAAPNVDIFTYRLASDGSGGAIVTWSDDRGGFEDIYAQRIDANGSVLWAPNGVPVCTKAGNQWNPELVSDGQGGAIITWYSAEGSDTLDIYAQRVDGNSAMLWTLNGEAICTAGGDQRAPRIASDGSGGAIIAWVDGRGGGCGSKIYAQRVDEGGSSLWEKDGLAVCAGGGAQEFHQIISDGSGGAVIVWEDGRDGLDAIYAQRIDANGSALWPSDGVAICATIGWHHDPVMASDHSGGAVVAWEDYRTGAADVYMQRIGGDGVVRWTSDGIALTKAYSSKTKVRVCSDGVGGAFAAWEDGRDGNLDVYCQRADAAGHTVIATLLRDYSAFLRGEEIEITWTLSEARDDVAFALRRSTVAGDASVDLPAAGIESEGLSFAFVDRSCEPATSYWYRVYICDAGTGDLLFEVGPITTPVRSLALYQNYPNPFNPVTTIRFYVGTDCAGALDVYDVRGTLIRRISEGPLGMGVHVVEWNGLDSSGRAASPGVYVCRLRAGKSVLSRKMIFLR